MGRHRRSAAGRAATSRATGVTQTHGSHADSRTSRDSYAGDRPTMGIAPYLNPEAYADSVARSQEYLFATGEGYAHDDTAVFAADGFRPDGGAPERGSARAAAGRRRKKRVATPVKTGLLGVSAAVAIGTVAVATGVVPGLDNYQLGGGGGSADKVQAANSPTNSASEQGGTSGSADSGRGGTSTSRDAGRSASPAAPASSAAPSSPSASASASATAPSETATEKPKATPSKEPETTPSESKRTATKAPPKAETPVTVSAEAQAAAEVLKLVNEERAKVGCSAVSANSALSDLAEQFSDDMAARGFFDHTDPDGATPWDRAAKAGISGLGGENIARGQADAAAVMEAWMNSPGHKANILNCDFKTLGVGVHLGSGGPWWTQDFGY
ncbi:CAP domain-containing protein [Streptomyces sp. MBT49]|uniref:CAP domain-containing protein n=1 Tax=unclassified Streptomyces TaxID=2593676 RepID=UPI00190BD1A7|nr:MULTISPECIES: CAP domain-containing protein [unclassified Streptomyces]MBK3623559.1 CAP domain-containing protein [Streptomyces sp. MBT49]MBK3632887.1 CAP domain-containing protein [Streptomyces sp. MBT97]